MTSIAYVRGFFSSALRLTILFFFLSVIQVFSQTADIRGFVYDKKTGEPVIFTNVYLSGTKYLATTDVNGYYSLSKVQPGSYILMASYLGYDTARVSVTVKAGDIITKKLYIQEGIITLKGVDITSKKQEARTNTRVSVTKITPKEIKQIPTVGGEPDLAQYLQIIPGVIFTGDQGGQLYIRGGSPIQNKVLLDGMIIYNPFHSIGLFSVFDADIIRNADVYTGGFGAEYGGRISSVMDIATRDGNKKRIGGKASATPFGAKLLVEGPLSKPKEEQKGGSSFILSAKNSYLDKTSKTLYSYIDSGGLPFSFSDYYGKMSFNSSNGSKLNIFGFNFNDKVNYRAVSDLHWNSSGGGANFIIIPGGSSILMEAVFAYSKYAISLEEKETPPRTSEISGFNGAINFTYFLRKNEVNYGLEMQGFKTDFQFYNAVQRRIQQNENTTELSGYLTYKYKGEKLILEPGFRAQYYASLANFSPEPRLSAKYLINDKLRVKLASGLYSQNLISADSDRDVVSLFYGFLSGPANLQETFDGREVTHKLQKATHLVIGFEYDLTNNLDLNIEAYQKYFNQLTNINRNKIYDDNEENALIANYLKKDFIIEKGHAEGIDFLLKYDYKRVYLWLAYSLAMVTKDDGRIVYNPHYDRRHNVNLVGSYTFGKKLDWEIDARWNLGSGFPFSQTQGIYPNNIFEDGINTDYTTSPEYLGVQYGELNKGRLSYYHRLDLTLKKKFELAEHSTLEAVAGITNVYNRKNIFYVDRIKYEKVYQLPFLPSLGVSLSF